KMRTSRPYAGKIRQVVEHVAYSHSEYHHPYLQAREISGVGLLVISSDRGLCGGLNNNLFKIITQQVKTWQQQGHDLCFSLVGQKAEAFFKRFGGEVIGSISHLGDAPAAGDLIGVVKVMLDAFDTGKIDALYIAYNEFVNTMRQTPKIVQLLPLPKSENEGLKRYWDYIYEPDAKELLDQLFARYIELQTYQAVLENIASEQAAKMVAMKSASDNAGDIIEGFQLAYNKARQAAITQELAEIVGGAAAL
ncbi:MAG: F0F1 ATP synthase subunit gamma, partial [Gammaproteobacteria bacterium]